MTRHRRRRALYPRPRTDTTVPSHNAIQHARIVLDLRLIEDNTLLDTYAWANDGFRTDTDIRTKFSRGIDFGGWMDEDRWQDVGRGFGDLR